MNYRYRRRLIVTYIRKLKRIHKLGQYSEVREFVCVYLNIKPNQLSKGALCRTMVQYWIKLSTKHPSETKDNFENSYLKSIILSVKNRTFYNIPIKIEIFCNQNSIGLKYFADIWFRMCLVHIFRQKWNNLGNENSAIYSK